MCRPACIKSFRRFGQSFVKVWNWQGRDPFTYPGRSFRPPEPVETGRILAGNDRKRPEPTGIDRFRHAPCNRIPAGFRRENSDDFPVGTNRNKLEFVWQKTGRNPVARNMAEHNGTGRFRPSKNHLGIIVHMVFIFWSFVTWRVFVRNVGKLLFKSVQLRPMCEQSFRSKFENIA